MTEPPIGPLVVLEKKWPNNLAPVAVDIGGSFTKIVYWRPPYAPTLPEYVVRDFKDSFFSASAPLKPDPSLAVDISEGSLRFLKFPSSRNVEFIDFIRDTKLHHAWGENKMKTICATGGGAYKYKELAEERLGTVFTQKDEMKCLVKGLNFCLNHVDREAFHYNFEEDKEEFLSVDQIKSTETNSPFPYLLVNIGSGISILKVEGENKFERVSGSSLGGGTFWGLAKALTDIKNFDEVRELSQSGDNRNVDLLVGDIYGGDYSTLGLKAELIASSFGKIAVKREDAPPSDYNKADVIKSLLFMISNNIGQIAYLNAQTCGVEKIIFTGGFLQDNSYVWSRLSYAVQFWSVGKMKATFVQHNSYLGSLGALFSGQNDKGTKEKTK
ncbi:pantothenate kinase 2-like [Planoprotostelium fungivorum]|uniref:pantothenate kinase n=1 Tax=Planoprotostelium fungivorum TaxID=1890364 RepID=A0A2P6MTM8_9EUKA|nr:pantothenate kinase 2-like [Planoprotostelium fungivorum]